jgi:hypothetical protein
MGARLDGETELGGRAMAPISSPRNFEYFVSATGCVPLRALANAFVDATPEALDSDLRSKLRGVFRHAAVRIENLARVVEDLERPDISLEALTRIEKRISDSSFTFQALELSAGHRSLKAP